MTIGPWRVTGTLGSGGMGTVYEAVRADGQFEQRVAVKLLDVGVDPSIADRFRLERQILASLAHPGIALLLDGGSTADGQPYLVLERVEGTPITEYATSQNLDTEARIRLFGQVCAALQYAHQHLVIHRDIKPANILVTGEGVAKLLDFGIAKLVDDHADHAQTVESVLTPAYASPEQLQGDPVSTATDIYLMGVLLYELLTSRNPHSLLASTGHNLERAVRDTDPPKPSQVVSETRLRRRLEGDLDTIVLTALQKEPDRRYSSVEQFWGDLQRHLDGRPVTARQDTLFYRTGKLVRRHRLAFGTAVVALLCLAAGAVVSIREAQREKRRFEQVRQLTNTFLFNFHDKIAGLPGSEDARQFVVRTALDYLRSLREEAVGDESLEWDIAEAYDKVGDVQGLNLGQTTAALESYGRALAIKDRLAVSSPTRRQLISLAQTCQRLADIQMQSGDTRGAAETLRRWSAATTRAGASAADDFRVLGTGYSRLGQLRAIAGDVPGMLEAFRLSQTQFERLYQLRPGAESEGLLAFGLQRLGYGHIWYGDVEAAVPYYRNAIAHAQKAVALQPLATALRRDLALSLLSLGDVLGSPFHISLGDAVEAAANYSQAVEVARQAVEADPQHAQAQMILNNTLCRLGNSLRDSDPPRAMALYREAFTLIDRLLRADPRNTLVRRDHGFNLLSIGILQERTGRLAESLATLRDCLSEQEGTAAADPARTQYRQDLIPTHLALARVHNAMGNRAEAARQLERALALAEAQLRASPHNLYTMRNLSDTFEALGKLGGRRDWLVRNLELWAKWQATHVASPYTVERRRRAEQLLKDAKA